MKDMQYRQKQRRSPGILLAGALFWVATFCDSTALRAAVHDAPRSEETSPHSVTNIVQPESAVAGWLDGSLQMTGPGEASATPYDAPPVILPPAATRPTHRGRRLQTGKPSGRHACRLATRFVHEAAIARDAGMNPGMFLATLERDLRILLSRPQDQRWLLHSDATAGLIRFAAVAVFNNPQPAARHARGFRQACLAYERASRRPATRRTVSD